MAIERPKGKVVWEELEEDLPNAAIVEIHGDTSTGRTRLALTAPWPCAYIHASEKYSGLAQAIRADKKASGLNSKIKLYNFYQRYRGSEDEIKRAARSTFNQVVAVIEDAFTWARSIVFDTHTTGWEVLRLAHFGKTSNVKSHWYGPCNAEWRNFVAMAREQDKTNLIFVGQMREKYVKDTATGTFEAAGMKEMTYLPDVILRTRRDTKSGVYSVEVEKGWYNDGESRGQELEGEMVTFENVMNLITGAEDERWAG